MQKGDGGGLARTGRADQGDGLAGHGLEIEIDHRGPLMIVRERHILEDHPAFQAAGIDCVRAIANVRDRVPDLEELPQARRLGHHAVHKRHGGFQARDDQACEVHEGDHLADARLAVHMQQRADHDDRKNGQSGGGPRQHCGNGPPRQDGHLRRKQASDHGAQFGYLLIEPREALYQGNVAQSVGGAFREVRIVTLDGTLECVGFAHDQGREQSEDNAEHNQQRCQPPVDEQRDRQQDN